MRRAGWLAGQAVCDLAGEGNMLQTLSQEARSVCVYTCSRHWAADSFQPKSLSVCVCVCVCVCVHVSACVCVCVCVHVCVCV